MLNISLIFIYLLILRSTIYKENKNNLSNFNSENNNDDSSAGDESSSDYDFTEDCSSLSESENKNEINLSSYKNLFNIVSFLVEKKLLTEEEMNKLFCLDLNLGNKWHKTILKNLEYCFVNTRIYFGYFLFHRCSQYLQDNIISFVYDFYDKNEKFDKNLIFEVSENIKLDDLQQKRLKIIINELYYKESEYKVKYINFEDNLKITIHPLNENQCHIDDSNLIAEYILYGYSRILLSKYPIRYLEPQARCFRFMLQSDVPKDVDDEDLRKYPKIKNYLDNISGDNEAILLELVYTKVYRDYYEFITNTLVCKKDPSK